MATFRKRNNKWQARIQLASGPTQARTFLRLTDAKEHRNANARGFMLPHIDLARESFEHIVGGEIEWEME